MKVMQKKSYGLIIYRKSLVNNKSSMFHLRRKKLQPNKINQHKPRTTARRLNREHSRFKTIDEISKYQQFSNENLNDYSKSEEKDFRGRGFWSGSIRRLLEKRPCNKFILHKGIPQHLLKQMLLS